MGYGRDEDVEVEIETKNSKFDRKVAEYFEYDDGEWDSLGYWEKVNKRKVYVRLTKLI